MKHSWIDVGNAKQERWARDYLQKKRAGVTRSINGNYVASQWDESVPVLHFLRSLEHRESCESSTALLKMMKAAWNQQVIKNQKKSRSIKISMKSSAHLRTLASKAGKTQYEVLEDLILGQYNALKDAEVQRKKSRDGMKLELERSRSELDAANLRVSRLEGEVTGNTDRIRELESELDEVNKKLMEEKQIINGLTARNLELSGR